MKYRPLLIILSALLFDVPFFIPSLCLFIFFFPTLLFYALCSAPITFFEGILLGSFVWGFHLWAPCIALFMMAHGSLCARSILPALFFGYMSLLTALWFYINSRLITHRNLSISIRYCMYSLSLFFYLFFIEYYCLSIGAWNGYPFANPLIVLTYKPILISLITYCGIPGAIFLFCMLAGSLALWIRHPTRATMLWLALWTTPWLASIANQPIHQSTPSWLARVGHIPIMLTAHDKQSMATALKWHMDNLLTKHPCLELIVMPESACATPPDWDKLPTYPTLCLGTFANNTRSRLNMCYFHSAAGLQYHAKQHTLPFAEGIPPSIVNSFCLSLFFKNTLPTCHGTEPRPSFTTPSRITLTPFICSELFFGTQPPDEEDKAIIVLCNDWWFSTRYFPRLMALTARLKAIAWKKPMIYISYRYAQYFDKYGSGHPIRTTNDLYFIE